MGLEDINTHLFQLLSSDALLSGLPLTLAIAAAKYSVVLLLALFLLAWFRTHARERGSLIYAVLCALIALGVNYALGLVFPHPRPFALGLSPNYLGHAAETSFPSDHATLMWTLAFGLLLNAKVRIYGWAAVALAALTSWARIFLGVHFPFDILGSIVVAAISLAAMVPLRPRIDKTILALSARLGFRI